MLENVTSDPTSPILRNWLSPSAPVVTRCTGVGTALRLVQEHGLPALPLVENGRLMGLVFERDLLRLAPSEATTLDVYEMRAVLDRLTAGSLLRRVPVLPPSASLIEALLYLGRDGLEAVPVADGDCLVGLLTWPALLAALREAFLPG